MSALREHEFFVARALELGHSVTVWQDDETILGESRDYDAIIKAIENLGECLLFFDMCKAGTAAVILDHGVKGDPLTIQDFTLDHPWLNTAWEDYQTILKRER